MSFMVGLLRSVTCYGFLVSLLGFNRRLMLQFEFYDLPPLLISLARDLKYFHDVELLYPSDTFQTFWIFNMFTCSYLIP